MPMTIDLAASAPNFGPRERILSDIATQYDQYRADAKTYHSAVFLMRCVGFLSSVLAAICLAFGTSDMARKTALVLSVVAAAVPAADQVFQVTANHSSSLRTAVDLGRLYLRCGGELDSANSESVESCRKTFNQLIDADIEVSLRQGTFNPPLQVPAGK
jgi:hypothetical protein